MRIRALNVVWLKGEDIEMTRLCLATVFERVRAIPSIQPTRFLVVVSTTRLSEKKIPSSVKSGWWFKDNTCIGKMAMMSAITMTLSARCLMLVVFVQFYP